MSEDIVAPMHEVLQLPWRRARAWCLPPLHLLLHTVASAASVCQFVAPASHPSLAALHGFSVGGAACLPPAVALEVREFVWGRELQPTSRPSAAQPAGTACLHACQ